MKNSIYKRTFFYFIISMTVVILVFLAFFIHYVNLRYTERFEEDQIYATEKTTDSISNLLMNIKQNAYFLCSNDTLAQAVVNKGGYDSATQRNLISHVFSLNTGTPSTPLMQSSYVSLFIDSQFPIATKIKGNFSFDILGQHRTNNK